MAPRALSAGQIEAFRSELCRVAARRFADEGFGGVTMRGLAADLGCSPMTPYRYFRNKEEIFAAVRAAALRRFADWVQDAAAGGEPSLARVHAVGRAYVRFALEEPDSFRIMFQLDQPASDSYPEVARETERAWRPLRAAVESAVESGAVRGDVDTLAHVLWAGLHGLVTLHLAGRLNLGRRLEDLVDPMWESLLGGVGNAPPEART